MCYCVFLNTWTITSVTPRDSNLPTDANPVIVFKYGPEEFQNTQNPIKVILVKSQENKFGMF